MIPFRQVYKTGRLIMKRIERKRPVFQVILKHGRDLKLEKIAAYRGQDKSALVKGWIDAAYSKLPEVAK
jgi:hypothetical protein